MDFLIGLLRQVPASVALVVIGLVVIGETGLLIGVVTPGASALLFLGFLTSLHTVGLPAAVITGSVAALTGVTCGFWAGRRIGFGRRLTSLAERFGRAELTGARPSGRTVVFGQWVVGVRTLMPRFAAGGGMSYPTYAARGVASAAVWGGTMVFVGYLAGNAYTTVSRWMGIVGAALVAAIVLSRILRRGAVRFGKPRRTRENPPADVPSKAGQAAEG